MPPKSRLQHHLLHYHTCTLALAFALVCRPFTCQSLPQLIPPCGTACQPYPTPPAATAGGAQAAGSNPRPTALHSSIRHGQAAHRLQVAAPCHPCTNRGMAGTARARAGANLAAGRRTPHHHAASKACHSQHTTAEQAVRAIQQQALPVQQSWVVQAASAWGLQHVLACFLGV